jgi:hypothetical protein
MFLRDLKRWKKDISIKIVVFRSISPFVLAILALLLLVISDARL